MGNDTCHCGVSASTLLEGLTGEYLRLQNSARSGYRSYHEGRQRDPE